MKKTAKQLKRLIEKDVERITGCEPGSSEYNLGCVMLAASQVGVNRRKISRLLQRRESDVEQLMNQLRTSGVFTRTRIYAEDWFGKNGGIGFNLDLCVAMGWITRA